MSDDYQDNEQNPLYKEHSTNWQCRSCGEEAWRSYLKKKKQQMNPWGEDATKEPKA